MSNLHHFRICALYFYGILKEYSTVHLYSFTVGQKSCVSNCARLLCKFSVFIYFRCVEIIDIVFYFPHAETFVIGHIIIKYPLLGSGNWIHNFICAVSGCIILQTFQKPSIEYHEWEV